MAHDRIIEISKKWTSFPKIDPKNWNFRKIFGWFFRICQWGFKLGDVLFRKCSIFWKCVLSKIKSVLEIGLKKKKIILTIYHCLGYGGFILFYFDFNYNTTKSALGRWNSFCLRAEKRAFWVVAHLLDFYPEHPQGHLHFAPGRIIPGESNLDSFSIRIFPDTQT